MDTVLAPVTPAQAASGVLFGSRIHNASAATITITAITVDPGIPGVKVRYMGYSDCSKGCPGSELWDAASQASLAAQLTGTLPVTVAPAPDRWTLVFLEQVDTSAFETRPCSSVHSVTMRLSTGATAAVAIPDGHSPVFGVAGNLDNKSKC